MKKHILSIYSERINKNFQHLESFSTSMETMTKDTSSLQEFILEPTKLTESIENSDADEFMLNDPTISTAIIEASDPDEFYAVSTTITTFQKEDSDPDEFIIKDILEINIQNKHNFDIVNSKNDKINYYDEDFDSILLI